MSSLQFTYPSINNYNEESDINFLNLQNCKWFIQEKVDGSQLNIQFDRNDLIFTNKKNRVHEESACFSKAIKQMNKKKDLLNPQYTYCGESFAKTKHNIINYTRVPRHSFICYDIYDKQNMCYLELDELIKECKRIDIEYVNIIYNNNDPNIIPSDKINLIMTKIKNNEIVSCLGGQVEGIVFKHNKYKVDDKILTTKKKIVIESFQERKFKQISEMDFDNITLFFIEMSKQFAVEARYHKAYIHLKEKEIDTHYESLCIELDKDFEKEYREEFEEYFYDICFMKIRDNSNSHLIEWMTNKCKLPIKELPKPDFYNINFFINELSSYYQSEIRYQEAFQYLTIHNKLKQNNNDYSIMKNYLNKEFEQYKNELIDLLWNSFHQNIKRYARYNFFEFYINQLAS
jgi:hypothetical protein